MSVQGVSGPHIPGGSIPDMNIEELMEVQRILRELGYGELIQENGILDQATQQAIRRFQQEHGLPVTGMLTQETLQALHNARQASPSGENTQVENTGTPEVEPRKGISRDAFRLDGEMRMVQIQYATVHTQQMGISPLNTPYRTRSPVSDSTRVFQNGRLDANRVIRLLSQYDRSQRTVEDPRRCGVTSMLAMAIKQKGVDGLRNVLKAVRFRIEEALAQDPPPHLQRRLQQYLRDLEQLERKLDAKTLTFGDLGKLQEIMFEAYKSSDGRTTGINGAGMLLMAEDFGLQRPSSLPRRPEDLQPGEIWPVQIPIYDQQGRLVTRHWILMGRDEDGRPFFYDPMPNSEGQQIFYRSDDINDLSQPYARFIFYLQSHENMPLPLSFDSAL